MEEPNPRTFPILSYVMSKLPQITPSKPNSTDLESNPSPPHDLPRLTDPKLLASMTRAVSDIAQTRSVLHLLGDRPDHESVEKAKSTMSDIDSRLSKQLEEIVLSPRPSDMDRLEWRSHLAEKEKATREAAEKEKRMCKAVVQLEEMHQAYENLLRVAEEKLEKIYHGSESSAADAEVKKENNEVVEESPVNEEVVGILREALGNAIDRVDLSNRRLKFMPEAFGRIRGLVALNLSANQLGFIPDSIAGLNNLEELNLSSNLLESLPDSIGMLHNLKLLDVSTNKLNTLPESICQCRSLVELDASFNNLTYLPTNIGYEFINLKKLSIHLNKIRSLPTSVCEMRSLSHLDAHFNELRGLPLAIGKLTNLETLNLSSNFSDLTELPDTIGELTNLRELDLSNNQIHALPDTFGRLDNLSKLNLDQNPIVIPPLEVVNAGVEAVKAFMAKRWLDILVEEERKSTLEMQEQTPSGWVTKGTSWLNNFVSGVSGNVGGYLIPNGRSPRDPLLDQQL